MTRDTQKSNIATIRQLLLAAFTPEELRRFCEDRPTFRPVVRRFGPGYGHDDMVDEVITYCRTRLLFKELLLEVKDHNPRQYARFEPDLCPPASTPPSSRNVPDFVHRKDPIAATRIRTAVTLDGYDKDADLTVYEINVWKDYADRAAGIVGTGNHGEKVRFIKQVDDGVLIELPNGEQGWVTYHFIKEYK